MFQPFDPQARFREVVLAAALLQAVTKLDIDQRFPRLVGLEESAGTWFSKQKIVVVGVGSVGRRIALHLARLGIGVLWLVDPGRYDDHANLLTQEILATDMGYSKADSTGTACKQISPATRVWVYEGKIQDVDPVVMSEADAVFLATDNLAVEIDASNQFRLLGIPIVQASVHGETLVAQVRFVANRRPGGCCLICSFGPEEYRHLNQSSIFRCTGAGQADGSGEQIHVLPTMSTSFLCSQAAGFALTQWVRHTLGLGQPVADTLLQHCGYTHHLTQAELVPNKSCRCLHTVLERVVLPRPLDEFSCSELAFFAGIEDRAWEASSLTLGDLQFVQSAVCHCGQHSVERFLRGGQPVGTCTRCNHPITPQPFYTSRPTPFSELKSRHDRPLRELGGTGAPWAVIQNGERGVLLRAEDRVEFSPTVLQESRHET